ncbi:MAG: hypothetical protein AVDCRST_MAG18-5161, partial [uncultured Thermomicrobiales bacterium]
ARLYSCADRGSAPPRRVRWRRRPPDGKPAEPERGGQPHSDGTRSRECSAHLDRRRGHPPGDRDDHDAHCPCGHGGAGERHGARPVPSGTGRLRQGTVEGRRADELRRDHPRWAAGRHGDLHRRWRIRGGDGQRQSRHRRDARSLPDRFRRAHLRPGQRAALDRDGAGDDRHPCGIPRGRGDDRGDRPQRHRPQPTDVAAGLLRQRPVPDHLAGAPIRRGLQRVAPTRALAGDAHGHPDGRHRHRQGDGDDPARHDRLLACRRRFRGGHRPANPLVRRGRAQLSGEVRDGALHLHPHRDTL